MTQIRKRIYSNKYMHMLLPIIANVMIKLHLMEKMIIVRCDGGVCSQINFWLIGRYFMDNGYKVKFDNDWFYLHGKDMNGIFDRNFDLLKMFPKLSYHLASPKENFYYRKCFRHINNPNKTEDKWRKKKPPIYLDGYYRNDPYTFKQTIKRYLQINYDVLDEKNRKLLMRIIRKNSVAIHVRRGDLSKFASSYGDPLPNAYYLYAIRKLRQIASMEKESCFFWFFSDEPEWVEEVLLPILQDEVKKDYFVVDINGSDRGYMDLLLMTGCKYIITSKGSLGKYAALLARKNIKKVIISGGGYSEWWSKVLDNVEILPEEEYENANI